MEKLLYGSGFHTAPFELYFENEPDYTKLDIQTKTLDIISEMTNSNICILDFYKHGYYYVSKNHFFNGYSLDETKFRGELLAHKIIFEQDRANQLQMKDAACMFFASHPPEVQKKITLFTNHRLTHKNGSVFIVSNQYKPIMFDDNGKMWLIMCITSIATKNVKVETYIEIHERKTKYVYSPSKKAFIEVASEILTNKEREVLLLSAQGLTVKEIAERQNLSQSTIKFHRQNIMTKFKVQNITEAICYADTHKIL